MLPLLTKNIDRVKPKGKKSRQCFFLCFLLAAETLTFLQALKRFSDYHEHKVLLLFQWLGINVFPSFQKH